MSSAKSRLPHEKATTITTQDWSSTLSCDNSNRLPRVGGHVKRKVRGTKRQIASVRGRVTGAGCRGIISASLTDFVSLQARRPTGFWATPKLKLPPVGRSPPPCCHSERSEESRSGLFRRETARRAAGLTPQRSALRLLHTLGVSRVIIRASHP